MSDVFKGESDVRQTDAEQLSPAQALFRPRYRKLTDDELELHDAIKAKAVELAALFAKIRRSAGKPAAAVTEFYQPDFLESIGGNRPANITLAVRHLEDAVYRAIKALTS